MLRTKSSTRLLILALIILLCPLFYLLTTAFHSSTSHPTPPSQSLASTPVRIAKATILYNHPHHHPVYEKALKWNAQHSTLHNHQFHVLRAQIVTGYANKLLWLQQVLVAELQKRPRGEQGGNDGDDKVDWIVYTSPSIVYPNPHIPLDHFIPPAGLSFNNIHFFASKIANNNSGGHTTRLDTSILFVRVAPASLRVLVKALAAPVNSAEGRVNWGERGVGDDDDDDDDDVAGIALQRVLEEDEMERGKAVWVPGEAWWFDSTSMTTDERGRRREVEADTGGDGVFLRILHDDKNEARKSSQMHKLDKALDVLQKNQENGNGAEIIKTDERNATARRKEQVDKFWGSVESAREMLEEARAGGHDGEGGKAFHEYRVLKDRLELFAWEQEELVRATKVLGKAMGKS